MHITLTSHLKSVVNRAQIRITFSLHYGLSLSTCNQLRQVTSIVLTKEKSLFISQQIFLIMIFQSKTSRSACRWKSKLINYLFPEFIMRHRLSSSFLAYCLIQFEKIELLSSNLRYFDLCDTF